MLRLFCVGSADLDRSNSYSVVHIAVWICRVGHQTELHFREQRTLVECLSNVVGFLKSAATQVLMPY